MEENTINNLEKIKKDDYITKIIVIQKYIRRFLIKKNIIKTFKGVKSFTPLIF